MKARKKSCFVSAHSLRNANTEHRTRLQSTDTLLPPLWQLHRTREQTPHLPHTHTHLSGGVPGRAGAPAAAPGHIKQLVMVSEASRPLTLSSLLWWLWGWRGVEVRTDRRGLRGAWWLRWEARRGFFWWLTMVYCDRLVQTSQRDERAPSTESSLEDSSLLPSLLDLTLQQHHQLRPHWRCGSFWWTGAAFWRCRFFFSSVSKKSCVAKETKAALSSP